MTETCKYCQVELAPSKRRVTGACSRCKHKHYRDKDPEKYKAYCAKQYAENKDYFRAKHKEWNEVNPEKKQEKDRRNSRYLSGQRTHGKHRAKRRGVEWSLTDDEFANIRGKDCHYCAGELNPTGSGLDRMDSDLGYTIGNVVPCCKACNQIKGDNLTYNEMIAAMAAVMSLRGKRG